MEDKNAMVECKSYDYLFEIGSRDRESKFPSMWFQVA